MQTLRGRRPWAAAALCTLALVAAAATGADAGSCKAVVAEQCVPCFPHSPTPYCEDWKAQCERNACQTLCLRETWIMKVTGTGSGEIGAAVNKEIATPRVQLALNGQYLADACTNVLGCCKDDDLIREWAEHRTYGGYFPTPLLPVEACRVADREKACAACKVSVELKSTKEKCNKYFEHPDVGGTLQPVFSRSMVPSAPETPKHKNFRVNCEDIAAAAEAQFGAIKARVEKQACTCLGCCDPGKGEDACPFPVMFNDVAQAIAEVEGGPKAKQDPPAADK